MDVGSGGGIVKLDGVELPHYPYSLEVGSGSNVIIEAVPKFAHTFRYWSGDIDLSDNAAVISISCDTNISAFFSPNWGLIGSAGGSLLLAVLLGTILIIRRK